MRLFRIAKKQYINDLSGEGARLFGGRWNKRGINMLYFSTHLSLAVLEILAHFDQSLTPNDLYFTEIEIDDDFINQTEDFSSIEAYLRINPPHYSTQEFGSTWIAKNELVGLKVPSAILPLESNIIINPQHKNWLNHKVIKTEILQLDTRVST